MSNRRKPTFEQKMARPWYDDGKSNRHEVKSLRPGAVITGTGPSGAYEDGPLTLARMEVSPADSVRTTAYRLHFTDGTSCVYYGDTIVTLAGARAHV